MNTIYRGEHDFATSRPDDLDLRNALAGLTEGGDCGHVGFPLYERLWVYLSKALNLTKLQIQRPCPTAYAFARRCIMWMRLAGAFEGRRPDDLGFWKTMLYQLKLTPMPSVR